MMNIFKAIGILRHKDKVDFASGRGKIERLKECMSEKDIDYMFKHNLIEECPPKFGGEYPHERYWMHTTKGTILRDIAVFDKYLKILPRHPLMFLRILYMLPKEWIEHSKDRAWYMESTIVNWERK